MSYDNCDPGTIKKAVEEAVVQYRLKVLADTIAQADIALAVAIALESEHSDDDE